METYTFEDYTLTLEYLGLNSRERRVKVGYTLSKEGESEAIFEGSDFGPSPMHDPEGPSSAAALLGFLTLREGDTDPDYFEDYTPRQTEFSESEAEDLQFWGYSLCCPQCGTEEPEEVEDFDVNDPPAWMMGQDPTRCDFCGTVL